MAKNEPRVKRPYASEVRRRSALATRRAVIDAAGRLFARQGYVATSIDEIAAAAGVSRATVFTSVGGKAELLTEAYRAAVRGEQPDVPLGDQQRSRAVMANPDPRALLAGYADVCAEFAPRLAPIYEAVRSAASADPQAAQLWSTLEGERRFGAGRVVHALIELRALRDGLAEESAGDILWVLNDPSVYRLLVERRGWPAGVFKAWLADAMQRQLLR